VGLLDILKPDQLNQTGVKEKKEKLSDTVSNALTAEQKYEKFKGIMHQSEHVHEDTSLEETHHETLESSIFINKSQHVRICKPKAYDDTERIGQAIIEGKVVILHMEDLDPNTATRILEFVYGMCFYANIEPENIDSKIFMIDPRNKRR
jgi:FtsZ-interacting cell division protein YlmF